ncbi:TPA: tail fiber assembly protein [Burkholderia vietnamiensis]|uniref:phage tail assembly chaperone n=1 Tax=Burkholderia cepacia complex TaxID=87882 RepID=UPI001593E1FA|nr:MULTISPECIES: phage tail assembly chaperone [Burkholderia cepacia complex]MCA8156169.1 phage tail assembly chaperone [Burkholderia contaminans]MCA8207989.1 phage tail assembly chaperone [Burkholderia vietnamiensis]HDR9098363.1 tail fiber assembly protein [Burkholderia vietnamiensis]HDR9116998.1 tail fiber assembly protein [Burkholderia vietnamiensis]HDR9166307.1 tail fiber assembly protein [Burkholderia vietnamiensis]
MGQKQAEMDAKRNIIAFYDTVDSPAPADADVIDLSDDQWLALINAQSAGKRLCVDPKGVPVALDPLPPTRAQSAETKRMQRDKALSATDWVVARHQDELVIGDGTTLTAAQYAAVIKYRQALRDISDAAKWPDVDLPAAPDFLTAIA